MTSEETGQASANKNQYSVNRKSGKNNSFKSKYARFVNSACKCLTDKIMWKSNSQVGRHSTVADENNIGSQRVADVVVTNDNEECTQDCFAKVILIENEKVCFLTNDKGSKVYVLGTNHVSSQSRTASAQLINSIKPHVVMIELCERRAGMKQPEIFKDSRLSWFQEDIDKELTDMAQKICYLLTLKEKKRARELKTHYGGEMFQPLIEYVARNVGGNPSNMVTIPMEPEYVIMCGDMPINITLEKLVKALGRDEKAIISISYYISKLFGFNCMLSWATKIARYNPECSKIWKNDRDTYLTYSIQLAADADFGECTKVVCLVGKNHMTGIIHKWGTVTDEEIKNIMTV